MTDDRLRALNPRAAVRLRNATCVYCHAPLKPSNVTKEHVVSRRFVPKGKMDQSWNLIVCACSDCNRLKASLEDDLSAITMQPDAWGQFAVKDPELASEARRKGAGSISQKTKRPVDQSAATLSMQGPKIAGGSTSFGAVAPPQPDKQRAFELARMQLAALFYWITFDVETRRGGFWLGGFHPMHAALRADWGNVGHRAFADAVRDWEPRVFAPFVGDGFFKVIIRRHPSEVCWAWALEWNHNYRLIGFFGERGSADAVASGFPTPQTEVLPQGPGRFARIRLEVSLPEEEDLLFRYDGAIEGLD